jgi:hypothetical protein
MPGMSEIIVLLRKCRIGLVFGFLAPPTGLRTISCVSFGASTFAGDGFDVVEEIFALDFGEDSRPTARIGKSFDASMRDIRAPGRCRDRVGVSLDKTAIDSFPSRDGNRSRSLLFGVELAEDEGCGDDMDPRVTGCCLLRPIPRVYESMASEELDPGEVKNNSGLSASSRVCEPEPSCVVFVLTTRRGISGMKAPELELEEWPPVIYVLLMSC